MAGITRGLVENALRDVYDPELGVNVVDLGLIYGIDINGDNVRVRMTLTTPGCPLHDSITEGVKAAIEAFRGITAGVDIVWDPPWDPDRMSNAAKQQLGWR